MNRSKGDIARYILLPQIAPRLKTLFASGFGNLAYFMALIYRAINLLPQNHPYLNIKDGIHYGIRDVLSEASSNLIFDAKHIDQIIVFFALIVGIIMCAIQFFLLFIAFLINPARAAAEMPDNYADFFTTENPKEDIALRFLDSVFGIPNIFGSKELDDTETAFHTALHGLFQFYSIGILIIAVMLIIYFIFAILAETAQTGTPFGKRYNHVWAPIRLVAAIGLLIPISYGMNAGQWITLYAAKFGSGFATNGWIVFNKSINDSLMKKETTVVIPNIPELKDLAAFMMLAHGCKQAYTNVEPDLGNSIEAYLVKSEDGDDALLLSATKYIKAVRYSNSKQIRIRFGQKNDEYADEIKTVYPYCGDLTLIIPEDPIKEVTEGSEAAKGGAILNGRYYVAIQQMWGDAGAEGGARTADGAYGEMIQAASDMVKSRLPVKANEDPIDTFNPPQSLKTEIEKKVKKHMEGGIDFAKKDLQKEVIKVEFKKNGWGGAGIWYNQIATLNGKMVNAAMNKPQVSLYPDPMEYVCQENKQQNEDTKPDECYELKPSKGRQVQFAKVVDEEVVSSINSIFDYWYKNNDGDHDGLFVAVINALLGTEGLFDMCKNTDINPLAQLSGLGKGLVEAAIRNLGLSFGTGAATILGGYFGPTLSAASSFLTTIAGIGLLIGFILYYLVPFLPFLYFMFAVSGWIKGIFEAMVGLPLWALAHIRIDGQGLPGDAAINGYFLIFEIFIRPILIVFGLLASILVFGAMVKVLNEVFSLAVSNLSGFNASVSACTADAAVDSGSPPTGSLEYFRGPVDEFFFTIVYTIIVYMIGMSCFKLIDLIPNNILRWMGQGVQTFNDQSGEPAEGLLQKMAIGGSIMGGQLQSAGGQFKQAAGNFAGAVKGGGEQS